LICQNGLFRADHLALLESLSVKKPTLKTQYLNL
jgi:hypothetical protein